MGKKLAAANAPLVNISTGDYNIGLFVDESTAALTTAAQRCVQSNTQPFVNVCLNDVHKSPTHPHTHAHNHDEHGN